MQIEKGHLGGEALSSWLAHRSTPPTVDSETSDEDPSIRRRVRTTVKVRERCIGKGTRALQVNRISFERIDDDDSKSCGRQCGYLFVKRESFFVTIDHAVSESSKETKGRQAAGLSSSNKTILN